MNAAGELRSAGLSAAGIEGDLGMSGDLTAPDDMEGDLGGADAAGGMAPAVAGPATPPAA